MRAIKDPYKIHEDGGFYCVLGPSIVPIYWRKMSSAQVVRTLCNIAYREGRKNAPRAYKKRLKK